MRVRVLCLALILFSNIPISSYAAGRSTGYGISPPFFMDTRLAVTGMVADSHNGSPVEFAIVTAIDESTQTPLDPVTTNANGEFFLRMENTTYRIDIYHQYDGYRSFTSTGYDPIANPSPVFSITTNTVVLAHGIFGSDKTWTSDEYNFRDNLTMAGDFYVPYPISMVPGGILSWIWSENGRVANQSNRLWQQISSLATDKGIKSVDIVAHSMGGLVSRHLGKHHPNRVRTIVMLGTPNHGTEFANFVYLINLYTMLVNCVQNPLSCFVPYTHYPPAAQDLMTGSKCLGMLNYNDESAGESNILCREHSNETTLESSTTYYTYAGTAFKWISDSGLFCKSMPFGEFWYYLSYATSIVSFCGTNDTIVPISSVPLMANSPCNPSANVFNWVDTDTDCYSSHKRGDCPRMTDDPPPI
ncbi:MAG: alpha/beta fold hydrolase [Candidatus Eisenbacteria bacterium]|nr:alpha/beta fold hydrolase [Candidatus Eisenbacteria bacterium]